MPVACLGDAGRLFRLAPAFGVHPTLAFRARLLMAAHLQERIDDSEQLRPELLAAMAYGFGDMVDLDAVDQELRLWNAAHLVPDYVAMHHLAWSQYPVRQGWARFQTEMRQLSAIATPEDGLR